MTLRHIPHSLVKRAVMNVTAIVAVCVIFGAKAMELEHRADETSAPVGLSAAAVTDGDTQ